MNSDILVKLANARMPFGKYQGKLLMELPQPYLVWFSRQGFPEGEIGTLMRLMLEINQNGTKNLLIPLKNGHSRP